MISQSVAARSKPRPLSAAVLLTACSVFALTAMSAYAQQPTGVPGSPSATTTIDGKQLPPPDPKFGGVIGESASQSKAWWAPRVVPPKGAPNILLIMLDDNGFGAPSTFGGVVPTPALDRIANAGVRYTNFHSTALCSPTRAALITGRNHHVAGFGVVGEAATGFPGYDFGHQEGDRHHRHHPEGARVRDLVVRQKPQHALLSGDPGRAIRSMADWYGVRIFLRLRRRRRQPVATEPVPQHDGDLPLRGQAGLEPDHGDGRRSHPAYGRTQGRRAGEAVLRLLRPRRRPCAASSTPEWIKKISDMRLFDDGWNKLRETIFANQKRLGIMPEDAQLTPWPKELPEWETLSFEEKRLFIRQMDVFMGIPRRIPITRSAESSRPSKTSASSTTL